MGKAGVNSRHAADTGDESADEVLLERFTARRDEAAFAALVRRYGPLVLGVCRRVLHHEQDAEDAFQAVFCVLARKAGAIRRGTAVGAWLYAVAGRVARKAKALQGRRHMRETDLSDVPAPNPPPEWMWRELRPILDEEVNRLPERYRRPFILCYLEGKTNEQAAAQLGCPLGTVSSRLVRARERLRTRLTRRGLALSAGMLAAVLGRHAAAATVRAELADAAVEAGVHYAAGQPVAAGVAAVADGFLKALAKARLLITLGLVSALGGVVAVVLLLWLLPRDTGPAGAPAPAGPAPAPQADREKLQGSWQAVRIEKGGQPPENPDLRFAFAGDQLTLIVAGIQTAPMRYVLDPSREPKAIDFTMPTGKILLGIYQLDGDSLKLCLDYDLAGVGGKRPATFRPPPGTPEVCLFVFQRARAAPGGP
jgi:RNA polymerase sigma factor (sigma-70 family)